MPDERRVNGAWRPWRIAAWALACIICGPHGPGSAAAAELKIATWNLEWLTARPAGNPSLPSDVRPKRADDIATLAGYAARLDADVVAFQEVDGAAEAARVFPPDRYRIAIISEPVVQQVGFAIRRDIPFTVNPEVSALDPDPEARYPLRDGEDVTLHLPGGDLRLLAVHLKTGCHFDPPTSRREACRMLARQVPPLAAWISARAREGVAFAVIGDFNRWLLPGDPIRAALDQAAPLLPVTDGLSSRCWEPGHFIDHILLGGPARTWLVSGSTREMLYRETDPAMKERLSDHCAVSARLQLPG